MRLLRKTGLLVNIRCLAGWFSLSTGQTGWATPMRKGIRQEREGREAVMETDKTCAERERGRGRGAIRAIIGVLDLPCLSARAKTPSVSHSLLSGSFGACVCADSHPYSLGSACRLRVLCLPRPLSFSPAPFRQQSVRATDDAGDGRRASL